MTNEGNVTFLDFTARRKPTSTSPSEKSQPVGMLSSDVVLVALFDRSVNGPEGELYLELSAALVSAWDEAGLPPVVNVPMSTMDTLRKLNVLKMRQEVLLHAEAQTL
jgi:hypothetical protein